MIISDIYNKDNGELLGILKIDGQHVLSSNPDTLFDLLASYVHSYASQHTNFRKAVDYKFLPLLKQSLIDGPKDYRGLQIDTHLTPMHPDKIFYYKYIGPAYQPRPDEQWVDENWQHVHSSNVSSVAYNPSFHRLYIEFKRRKGGHSVYQYEDVPPDIHDQMLAAASKGRFVYYVIRNNGSDSEYAYRQID